jgi:hypothetical protein
MVLQAVKVQQEAATVWMQRGCNLRRKLCTSRTDV